MFESLRVIPNVCRQSLLVFLYACIARKNGHKFPNAEEESSYLIYNYTPMFTGNSSLFEQKYYF